MRKKLLLGLMALAVMGGTAYAAGGQREVPLDQRGQPVSPWYGGYSHMRNSGTGQMQICSGRCLLAGLIMSTGSPLNSVRILNTALAVDGALVLSNHVFNIMNTIPGNNPIVLPMLLDKGIRIELNSVTNQEQVTVLYLDLD